MKTMNKAVESRRKIMKRLILGTSLLSFVLCLISCSKHKKAEVTYEKLFGAGKVEITLYADEDTIEKIDIITKTPLSDKSEEEAALLPKQIEKDFEEMEPIEGITLSFDTTQDLITTTKQFDLSKKEACEDLPRDANFMKFKQKKDYISLEEMKEYMESQEYRMQQ